MHHPNHQVRGLLAVLLLCMLLTGGALAAEVRVDPASVYCFSPDDFTGSTRGIYVREVPAAAIGTLCCGTRTLRPGDVLPTDALETIEFRPASEVETECSLVYCGITEQGIGSAETLRLQLVQKKDTVPVCETVEFETYKNIANSGMLRGSDEDGDPLTYQLVKEPKRGTVELAEDGSFTYTPDHNKAGRDSFVYTAVDPAGNVSNEARVKIRIVKPTDAASFADLAGDALEYRAMALKDMGVYGGREIAGQRCFCPDETVTRGEFLVMAMRVLDLAPEEAVLTSGFADESDAPGWMRPYIAAAYRSGVISGTATEDGLMLRPAAALSKAECAVLLQNMLHLPEPDTASVFATARQEEAAASWAVASSAALETVGIELPPLSGESVTRRECAELLYQLSTLCQEDVLKDFYWSN